MTLHYHNEKYNFPGLCIHFIIVIIEFGTVFGLLCYYSALNYVPTESILIQMILSKLRVCSFQKLFNSHNKSLQISVDNE